MKKILLIGMTSGVGGVETFISNIINNINKNEFQIDVLLFQNTNPKYESTLKNASNVYKINAINKHPLRYLKDIVKFYHTHIYDVVHVSECTAKLFVYCWPTVFRKKSSLIIHSHNGNGNAEFAHKVLASIQKKVATQLWSCSNEASKWMFGKCNRKIELVRNGIDVGKYRYSSRVRFNYRLKFGIKNDTCVIGSIARFEEQKNHKRIIDIFNEYHKTNSNTVLFLVGEGSKKKEMIDYTRVLNIGNSVFFLGNRNDIPNLLQMFDLLLMPSLYEGLPFVVLEAQAAGVPVIASDTVDMECNVTGSVSFVSLHKSDVTWINVLKRSFSEIKDREDDESIIDAFNQKGYSLEKTMVQIQRLYSGQGSEK